MVIVALASPCTATTISMACTQLRDRSRRANRAVDLHERPRGAVRRAVRCAGRAIFDTAQRVEVDPAAAGEQRETRGNTPTWPAHDDPAYHRPPAGSRRYHPRVAYRFLAWLLRVATRVFFRQIEVVGLEHVPADGPVIFAGNHPNSLIDPVLIITTCGRKIHFAAKDSLFKGRIMRALLGGLGAVPILRREDHAGVVDNQAAFAAMFDVLGRGGAIGIFPEGLSHDESQLARLKTGAARLALGGAHRVARSISIVPCGLTFIHPKRFRSRVLVQYGPALTITPEIGESSDEVHTVTDEIGAALRRLTVNAPDWETVRALDAVRRLYQPQEISIEERVELARRFNAYYAAVADDPRVVALMTRVHAYQDKLDDARRQRPRARARPVEARGPRARRPPARARRVLVAADDPRCAAAPAAARARAVRQAARCRRARTCSRRPSSCSGSRSCCSPMRRRSR